MLSTIVIGSSSVISTSKIRKITATRTNHSENGSWADFFGSNPHLNGDLSSRSSVFSPDSRDVVIKMAVVSVSTTVVAVVIIILDK
jgi:hypothetical protein